ncbi:MAG: hypothetical protein R3C43_09540 [Chloroflexota bacterium]
MDKMTFTIAEIRTAFEALKRDIDSVGGSGASATDRFLIDDVATDVERFLTGTAPWAAAECEREADDDETLFMGQNYNWLAANGEW